MVALHPVPTITPMATRLFGRDLTKYARDESVATVSLVIAAIFNLGKAKSLRLLAKCSSTPYGCRVCRSYPANRILRRSRSEEIAKPFPIGISIASPSDSCLLLVSVEIDRSHHVSLHGESASGIGLPRHLSRASLEPLKRP